MPKKAGPEFDEGTLTKGQLRKLNALRKSLGDTIADEAFAKWLKHDSEFTKSEDRNAALIANALEPLVKAKKLKIPRGGYLVKRGRGRVIVEIPEYT